MLWASIFLAACSLVACGSSSGAATHDGGAGAGGASGHAGAGGGPGNGGAAPVCVATPTFKGPLHTQWARAFPYSWRAGAIGVSAGGLVYGGDFAGTLDVGGTTYSNTGTDVEPIIAAYDATGKLRWSHAYPGARAWIQGVATDPQGDIAIAGELDKGFDLGTGPLSGTFFLAKLDASGHTLWAKAFGTQQTTGYLGPQSIAMDAGGRVAVSGGLGFPTDFGGGTLAAPPGGGFLALFDANGKHVFSHAVGTTKVRVRFDASGQLLVAGNALGAIDLGSGPIQLSGAPGGSGFAAALDASGKQVWAHAWPSVRIDAVASRPGGGAVIAGSVLGSLDLGLGVVASTGALDMYVAWLDASGTPVRQTTFAAGGDFINGYNDAVSDVAVSSSDQTMLVARTSDPVDPGGGPLWPGGMLVARFDAAGKYVSSARFDGPPSDAQPAQVRFAGDNAFVLGTHQDGPFDTGAGELPGAQGASQFVVELAPSSAPAQAQCTPPPVVLPDGSRQVAAERPAEFVADATNVYWTRGTELKSVPRAGGPTSLLVFGKPYIRGLARVGSRLFYTVMGAGTIESVATTGGKPTVVRSGLAFPEALVADWHTLYFVTVNNKVPDVESMPITGGATKQLATLAPVNGLALDSGAVYASTQDTQYAIQRIPIAGGAPTVLATSQSPIGGFASDGKYVYYTVTDADTLMRVPVGGGAAETVAHQLSPVGVQLHGGDVYWASQGFFTTDLSKGSLSREPKAGGTPEVFANDLYDPLQLLVDDAGIVWTSGTAIYTRPLP